MALEQLHSLFPEGVAEWPPPDKAAKDALCLLAQRWPSAAFHAVKELKINRSGRRVTVTQLDGLDSDGYAVFSVSPNQQHQGYFNASRALTAIVNRWYKRQCNRARGGEATTTAAPAKRSRSTATPPAESVFYPSQEISRSTAMPPAESVFYPSQEIISSAYLAELDQAEREQEKNKRERALDNPLVPYEIRFRLLGAGALLSDLSGNDLIGLVADLNQCSQRAKQRGQQLDAAADELNAIGKRYGLTLGFLRPSSHTTIIFQVTVMLNGALRYDPPIEVGQCVAHRRLKRLLLRVRFEALPKGSSREASERRASLRRQTFDQGLHDVAGRDFLQFVHKDADKGEAKAQYWFARVEDQSLAPAKQMLRLRDFLLDSLAFANGRGGKRLSIAKLNARLCLAFSSTVPIEGAACSVPTPLRSSRRRRCSSRRVARPGWSARCRSVPCAAVPRPPTPEPAPPKPRLP